VKEGVFHSGEGKQDNDGSNGGIACRGSAPAPGIYEASSAHPSWSGRTRCRSDVLRVMSSDLRIAAEIVAVQGEEVGHAIDVQYRHPPRVMHRCQPRRPHAAGERRRADQAHQGLATQIRNAPQCGASQTESASTASKRPHARGGGFPRPRARSAPRAGGRRLVSDPRPRHQSLDGCCHWGGRIGADDFQTGTVHPSTVLLPSAPVQACGPPLAAAPERSLRPQRIDPIPGLSAV
jgi:hypothetical protein